MEPPSVPDEEFWPFVEVEDSELLAPASAVLGDCALPSELLVLVEELAP